MTCHMMAILKGKIVKDGTCMLGAAEGSCGFKPGMQGVSHGGGDKYKDLKAGLLEQALWGSRRTVQTERRV